MFIDNFFDKCRESDYDTKEQSQWKRTHRKNNLFFHTPSPNV
jgi:hypothetical protein